MPLLILVLLLDTAIEKEGYMGVFLRFFAASAQITFRVLVSYRRRELA